jgi:hypothetical protein
MVVSFWSWWRNDCLVSRRCWSVGISGVRWSCVGCRFNNRNNWCPVLRFARSAITVAWLAHVVAPTCLFVSQRLGRIIAFWINALATHTLTVSEAGRTIKLFHFLASVVKAGPISSTVLVRDAESALVSVKIAHIRLAHLVCIKNTLPADWELFVTFKLLDTAEGRGWVTVGGEFFSKLGVTWIEVGNAFVTHVLSIWKLWTLSWDALCTILARNSVVNLLWALIIVGFGVVWNVFAVFGCWVAP